MGSEVLREEESMIWVKMHFLDGKTKHCKNFN